MALASNANDTTTALSPASQSGGDSMDESLVLQSDGVTQGKRPRVDLGFRTDDTQERLVSKQAPLPVEPGQIEYLLTQILDELRKLRFTIDAALGGGAGEEMDHL